MNVIYRWLLKRLHNNCRCKNCKFWVYKCLGYGCCCYFNMYYLGEDRPMKSNTITYRNSFCLFYEPL